MEAGSRQRSKQQGYTITAESLEALLRSTKLNSAASYIHKAQSQRSTLGAKAQRTTYQLISLSALKPGDENVSSRDNIVISRFITLIGKATSKTG